jgi:putrescine aminotransferase
MSDLRARGSRHVWNPMSRMSDVLDRQRVWVRGEGSLLFDEDGRAFIDGCASLWYANVGYGRREIVEAVERQMSELPAWMLFGPNLTPATVELAERLAALTPGDLNRMYFTCGGSESVEIAFKIARQYCRLSGQGRRYKILARRGSYHGSTFGALSATGTPANRSMFEPLVPGFRHVAPFSTEALAETIEFEDPETIAAMIVDPASAASGIRFPADDYFAEVRRICSDHGILLISDEVICGFGRTGTWFGLEHWGVVPDLIAMAKGLSSGYLPVGAVAVSDRVVEAFASGAPPDRSFMSGNTYAGHATCCAAALANIEIIERERLLDRSAAEGARLFDLCKRFEDSPLVKEVRGGRGLAVGIELEDELAGPVAEGAFDLGVLVRPLTPSVITVSPPLVITPEEVTAIANAVGAALSDLERRASPAAAGIGT